MKGWLFVFLTLWSLGHSKYYQCKRFLANASQCVSDLLPSSEFMPHERQKLHHCSQINFNTSACSAFWIPSRRKYVLQLRDHYEKMSTASNHSVNKVDRATPEIDDMHTSLRIDIAVDTRCHHSWPVRFVLFIFESKPVQIHLACAVQSLSPVCRLLDIYPAGAAILHGTPTILSSATSSWVQNESCSDCR